MHFLPEECLQTRQFMYLQPPKTGLWNEVSPLIGYMSSLSCGDLCVRRQVSTLSQTRFEGEQCEL
jgi:hypothetical protein